MAPHRGFLSFRAVNKSCAFHLSITMLFPAIKNIFPHQKKPLNFIKHRLMGQLSSTMSFRDPDFLYHLFYNSLGVFWVGEEGRQEGRIYFYLLCARQSFAHVFLNSHDQSPLLQILPFPNSLYSLFLWSIIWTFSFNPQLLLNLLSYFLSFHSSLLPVHTF